MYNVMFDMSYESVSSQLICGTFSGSRENERESQQDEKLRICQVSDVMRCLRLVASLKLQISFAKKPCTKDNIRDNILQ